MSPVSACGGELEKRGDMHVSILRHYVEALGTLEVTARFADTTIMIRNLGESDASQRQSGTN
jgi:hypothetical protein